MSQDNCVWLNLWVFPALVQHQCSCSRSNFHFLASSYEWRKLSHGLEFALFKCVCVCVRMYCIFAHKFWARAPCWMLAGWLAANVIVLWIVLQHQHKTAQQEWFWMAKTIKENIGKIMQSFSQAFETAFHTLQLLSPVPLLLRSALFSWLSCSLSSSSVFGNASLWHETGKQSRRCK